MTGGSDVAQEPNHEIAEELFGATYPSTQRFKSMLTAGNYLFDWTVGTDPPLHPEPRRVRNRVVPVPCRGFQLAYHGFSDAATMT